MILSTLASSDSSFIDALAREIELVIIFVGGGLIAITAIIFGTLTSMSTKKADEQTRRELAAYVAEGSMTPEDAERILTANRSKEDD